jgi:membrane protein required for colicin V production
MIWLDYAFLVVVLLSMLVGVLRGFVREALSLVTWILAVILALRYGALLGEEFRPSIHSLPLRVAAGSAAVFLLTILAGSLAIWLVGLLIENIGLRPADRMLGAGFGLLRGLALVVIAVLLLGLTTMREGSAWRASLLRPKIEPLAAEVRRLIPDSWLAYLQTQEPLPAQAAAQSTSAARQD